jgi:hypothetical protein
MADAESPNENPLHADGAQTTVDGVKPAAIESPTASDFEKGGGSPNTKMRRQSSHKAMKGQPPGTVEAAYYKLGHLIARQRHA